MSDVEAGRIRVEPVIDQPASSGSVWLLILLSTVLVAVAVMFAFMTREQAEPYVLLMLGVLAMIGIFSLFALTVGFFRIGAKPKGHDLARAFVDTMAEGAVVTDSDGRIVYANRSYADLINALSASDVRGVERVFSSDPEAAERIYRLVKAVADGRRAAEEIRMPHGLGRTEGAPRWYRVRVRPLQTPGEDGTKGRMLTVWQVADITRDRDEQETSFQQLQQVVTFLDHAPAGFFSANRAGKITYLNATLADWLGYDLAQFESGQIGLTDLVQGQGAALVMNAAASGPPSKTQIIDIDLVKKNGQSLPVRLMHRVPHAADGTPGDSRTLVLNRSPGEDASETLRAAEVRFARFFNNTPIAIAAVKRDGELGRANAPFLRLMGQTAGPSRGADGDVTRSLTELVSQTDRPRLVQALQAATQGQSNIPAIDLPLVAGSDPHKKRSARFFVSGVVDGEGDGEAAIVYALDTTEQRELESQFAQSQKMQAIGQLAGGIAHDFNNVLTAIIGFSDLLLASHRPADPSFQDIMNIKQNANRAAALVRQLLAFSRRQTLRPEVLSLGDTIADLQMLLGRLMGEKISLDVVHGRDLWPIRADHSQLEQVIVNLAVNARDASPQGGKLTIKTANVLAQDTARYVAPGLPEADYVMIEVADSGTGIPPDILEKIFEPFFTTKPIGQGTGLGLSTVYGIVKQTGGFIYCESEVGKGTTFRIFLPRHTETEDAAKPVEDKAVAMAAAAPAPDLTGSASILLVEDEEAVRAFGKRALESRGYKVFEAASGTEALDVMAEVGGKIDLVVSDVLMPEMDGPSLLRELRKTQPHLKIIFVSGYAEDAFAKNLEEGETFGFLPKPFTLKQLAQAVKTTLEE